MAAPTLVRGWATQASATAVLPPTATNTNPQVGDLCVIMALGTQTAVPNTTISYSGAGDAGYDLHGTVDGTGTARARLWSKVLAAADFSSGQMKQVGPTGWVNNGTSRIVMFVFRHADGWGSAADRLLTYGGHNSNVANGSNVATTSDSTRAVVGVTGVSFAAAQNALVIDWDDGTAAAPFVDESTTTNDTTGPYGTGTGAIQADEKLYDTTATAASVGYSAGLANTTHAIVTAWFRVALPVITAQGRGDTVTDARGTGARTRTSSGRGDTVSDAAGQTRAPLTARGRGDTVTDGRGTGARTRTAHGRGDTVTDGRGTAGQNLSPGDTTSYGYGFSTVVLRAGGRGDTVTDARGRQSAIKTAGGRGDTVTDAHALSTLLRRAFGFGDTTTAATGQAPRRNLTIRLGAPTRRWTAADPTRRWWSGQPGSRWRPGPPQD